jgi:membrane-associated protein
MAWLTLHTHLAYGVLFAGAYFEALVGPSFFIPGEIFLLGGSILAGSGVLDIWLVLIALYGGAILGDSSSYFIGRKIGSSIFHERNKFLSIKNYKRVEQLLEKHGLKAIFFARLIGPFNKIAPALAGIFEIPFQKFLLYNIPGVIVGCGEFIVAGYFFGNQYELILLIIEKYILALGLLLGLFFFLRWYFKMPTKISEEVEGDTV